MHSFNSWVRESTIIISHNLWPNRILSCNFSIISLVYCEKNIFLIMGPTTSNAHIWSEHVELIAGLLSFKWKSTYLTSWLGVQSLKHWECLKVSEIFYYFAFQNASSFQCLSLIFCAELGHSWPPYGCVWGSWFCDSRIHIESTSVGNTILPSTVLLPGNLIFLILWPTVMSRCRLINLRANCTKLNWDTIELFINLMGFFVGS